MTESIKYEHPSYVTVSFHRISCTPGMALFGSNLKHQNVIQLQITEAVRSHEADLSNEDIFGHKQIIAVDMSPSQFAELITTMNMGEGVPGTLSRFQGRMYEAPEVETKAQEFKADIDKTLKETMGDLLDAEKRAEELLTASSPLKKDEKKELLSLIQTVTRTFKDHLPFVMDQFSRSMGKIADEAKASVEEFVNHAVEKTGLESLKANRPELPITKE